MRHRRGLIGPVATAVVFILLEVFSIILIAKHGVLQRFKIMAALNSIQSSFWEAEQNGERYLSLRDENNLLVEENRLLRERVGYLESRLLAIDTLLPSGDGTYSYMSATVIKNAPYRQSNWFIIDKGSDVGVTEGMGVVTQYGIVGIVNAVSRRYAYVISFQHPSVSVSAKLKNSDYFGPMQWDGLHSDRARMTDMPLSCQAMPGDTIVSSGFSAIFPADIPLGVVTGSTDIEGVYTNLEIRLFQDFRRLNHVYLVLNRNMEEINRVEQEGRKNE